MTQSLHHCEFLASRDGNSILFRLILHLRKNLENTESVELRVSHDTSHEYLFRILFWDNKRSEPSLIVFYALVGLI